MVPQIIAVRSTLNDPRAWEFLVWAAAGQGGDPEGKLHLFGKCRLGGAIRMKQFGSEVYLSARLKNWCPFQAISGIIC
jgi:hypothetical protein